MTFDDQHMMPFVFTVFGFIIREMQSAMFDFAAFPSLRTERLRLRELHIEDAFDVLAFRGDPEVQRYNGPVLKLLEEVQDFIEVMRAEYAEKLSVPWAVALDSGSVIGLVGLHHWDAYHRRAELGYDFARAYWGKGLASEAIRAVLKFAFTETTLRRVEASTILVNHASVRLLKALGFRHEGTRREFSLEDDGQFYDSAVFGLLKNEFI